MDNSRNRRFDAIYFCEGTSREVDSDASCISGNGCIDLRTDDAYTIEKSI